MTKILRAAQFQARIVPSKTQFQARIVPSKIISTTRDRRLTASQLTNASDRNDRLTKPNNEEKPLQLTRNANTLKRTLMIVETAWMGPTWK